MKSFDIIVIGSGNAALCAGISALEHGASVLIVEKAGEAEMGGNSRYTAGAMRFAYESNEDLLPLLKHPDDARLAETDFGSYPKEQFLADLQHFNEGEPLTDLQHFLVEESLSALQWLGSHNIKFDPIYSRQSFKKEGKYVFWGGLTLEAEGEGDGLVQSEIAEFKRMGGEIWYACEAVGIIQNHEKISGLKCLRNGEVEEIPCKAVVLGCGGFEANKAMRVKYLGENWEHAKVRGTRHNLGHGLTMAMQLGAALNGFFGGCHAVPMDRNMPDYGNLELPFIERKHYRKISYLFGVMLNSEGNRFVDEGADMRNYTYAQFGKAVLEQPNHVAWQFFDAKTEPYLYSEYRQDHTSVFEANSLPELVAQIADIDNEQALKTFYEYNAATAQNVDIPFDPTRKDGKKTDGLALPKSNWALALDTPPFKAYPVTSGITFTYGGVKVNRKGEVLNTDDSPISGLYACGEMVGGVFFYGYPGGSGLTSGTVFGRTAGKSAAFLVMNNDL